MMAGPSTLPGDANQVPRSVRVAYGIGSIADGAKNTGFNAFLMLYYVTVLGLPGTLAGLAIFIALVVDAVTDPLVGSLSDNFRSRWGPRHPFMYFAAIPMGLCFFGLFSPPSGLEQDALFAWMLTFSIGVRLFLTFYMVPSNALGPEMTSNYDERTTLMSFRWLIGWCGGITLATMGWLVFLPDGATNASGRLTAENFPALGAFAGFLVAGAILASSIGTHRMIPRLRQPDVSARGFSFGGFANEVVSAFRNHSLRVLLGSSIFSATALGVSEVLGTYMSTWFWGFHSSEMGLLSALQIVPLLIGVSLVGRISGGSRDKRKAAIGLALFAILWGPLTVLARFAGIAPENGSVLLPLFIMGHGVFLVAALIQIGILNSSMVMDVTDEVEYETGRSQQGVIMAVIGFTGKAVSGFGNFLGGVILDWIEFPQGATDAALGNVPEETIFQLGLIAGPGLVVFHLTALWFVSRLRLTRGRYAEISDALALRRAQASTESSPEP